MLNAERRMLNPECRVQKAGVRGPKSEIENLKSKIKNQGGHGRESKGISGPLAHPDRHHLSNQPEEKAPHRRPA